MKYTYFVAYNYWTKDGHWGSGNMEVFTTKKIKSFGDLQTTRDLIKKDLENQDIDVNRTPIITNFILLNKKIEW